MNKKIKIFVLGGYGNLGKGICTVLAHDPAFEVIVGGRDQKKIEMLIEKIKSRIPYASLEGKQIDWQAQEFKEKLEVSGAQILIHSASPSQDQEHIVARTCIDLKIHYLDLSERRDFLVKIRELDKIAKENRVIVISGASAVPSLSSVVIDEYAKKFSILKEINLGIALGNQAESGGAMIATILKETGKPFCRLENGAWKTVYGGQDLHRYYYGDNLGMRWQANMHIPDLVLLSERYTTLKTVTCYLGLEIALLHFMMWGMSWLSRMKVVNNWGKFYKYIVFVRRWCDRFGTDTSGMTIRMRGTNHDYQPLELKWVLVAQAGSGSFIPMIAMIILVKKILEGAVSPGAMPCVGLFSLKECDNMIALWDIYYTVEERVA